MGRGRVKLSGMLGSAVAPPNLWQGAIALKHPASLKIGFPFDEQQTIMKNVTSSFSYDAV